MTRTWPAVLSTCSLLAGAAVLGSSRSAPALETDILFSGNQVKPNVLLLFDNSGSMNNKPTYDPDSTYPGPYSRNTVYHRCSQYYANCSCRRTQTTWTVASGSCGFVDTNNDGVDDRTVYKKLGNRLNYEAGGANKIQIARSVITSMLNNPANENVRFGLMTYNGNYNVNDGSLYDPQNFANWHNDILLP